MLTGCTPGGRQGAAMRIVRTRATRGGRPRPSRRKAGPYARREAVWGWAVLLAAAVFTVLLTALLLHPLRQLIADPRRMREFIHSQGAFGAAAFWGIQILQGFLPIPLELTAAAGGYLFGRAQGFLLSVSSAAVSTAAIYLFTVEYGHRAADRFFPPEKQRGARWFRSEKLRDLTTFLVFLVPGTPKRLFVFTAGLVPQDFRRFLLISTAARAPSLLACSFGGGAIGSGEYRLGAGLLLLVCVLGAAGCVLYRRTQPGGKGP